MFCNPNDCVDTKSNGGVAVDCIKWGQAKERKKGGRSASRGFEDVIVGVEGCRCLGRRVRLDGMGGREV